MNRLKMFVVSLLALAILFAPASNAVEVTSAVATVSLSMSVSESITVSATPANISFLYSSAGSGTATASAPINVTATWSLAAGHPAGVVVQAWFSSATAALSGPSPIPSSEVFQALNGGAAVPCTQTIDPASGIGVAGAACPMILTGPGPAPAGSDGRNGTVVLSMAGLGNLTPGTYTGVYSIEGYIL